MKIVKCKIENDRARDNNSLNPPQSPFDKGEEIIISPLLKGLGEIAKGLT